MRITLPFYPLKRNPIRENMGIMKCLVEILIVATHCDHPAAVSSIVTAEPTLIQSDR